jgi:hypothetical protein
MSSEFSFFFSLSISFSLSLYIPLWFCSPLTFSHKLGKVSSSLFLITVKTSSPLELLQLKARIMTGGRAVPQTEKHELVPHIKQRVLGIQDNICMNTFVYNPLRVMDW